MSRAAVLFLLLAAIEAPLIVGAARARTRGMRSGMTIAATTVPVALILAVRAFQAFHTHQVIDWDETYYVSLAVTGAAGHGLYPYIFGFGPMPIMGGIGYAAYSYALAVRLFGPTIDALRGVSLLMAVVGLAGFWVAVRTWYGSAAAWMGMAAAASLQIFALSNTARMDCWTFAWVSWSLAVVAIALERGGRWHLLAGLMFGLGLQVHIDTAATAAACGLVYLWIYVEAARRARRVWVPRAPILYLSAGLLAGVAVYVAANILPDPASYYTMTVRVRLDATKSYSGGTSNILSSFLNPRILLAKETLRYRQLFAMLPLPEMLLAIAGLGAALVRRTSADRIVLTIAAGVVAAAAALLNNASPLYYIHVVPALLLPLGPLFAAGLSRDVRQGSHSASIPRVAVAALVTCALAAGTAARTLRAAGVRASPPAAAIARFREVVDRRCKVAGDAGLYVPHFTDYPYFISSRRTEVALAMLFYRTDDETHYWAIKQPDVVFATSPLTPGLSDYVAGRRMVEREPGIWMLPEGCRGGP